MLPSGADVGQVKREDAGPVLADTLRSFLFDLQVEDGLGALGYAPDDVPALVKGTIPQVRSGTLRLVPVLVSVQAHPLSCGGFRTFDLLWAKRGEALGWFLLHQICRVKV